MDIKENIAKNITTYRKASNLTQLDLAEKLHYSDKAVSKWERGDAVPDIVTLKSIADLFGITVDTLIGDPKRAKPKSKYNLSKRRIILAACSAGIVWLVAIVAYAFIGLIFEELISVSWLSLIVAIPITFIVLLVLTSVWGKNIWNAVFSSFLVWTLLLAVYLCLFKLLSTPPLRLWLIFIIGIPLQVLIVLWFTYKNVNRQHKDNAEI